MLHVSFHKHTQFYIQYSYIYVYHTYTYTLCIVYVNIYVITEVASLAPHRRLQVPPLVPRRHMLEHRVGLGLTYQNITYIIAY